MAKHIGASASHFSVETGWQKFLEKNTPDSTKSWLSAGTVVTSIAACFPLLHLHWSIQVVSSTELMQLIMTVESSVRSAGAQKSRSGIKSVPLLHMHFPSQVVAVLVMQSAKSFSVREVPTTGAGWQNSLVKSGVSAAGVFGLLSGTLTQEHSAVLSQDG